MKAKVFGLVLIFVAAVLRVDAQENEQPRPPDKYRMELVYIFEGQTTEFVFVIGQVGFKSVDSLKKFIANLPAGSILEWAPGCRRMGREPLLSSESEMAEFMKFCVENRITFVLVPAG